MEIINNASELITLSIAKTQTIQYWSMRIIEVMQAKRKASITIENVELVNTKNHVFNDSVYYAIAQTDTNHSLVLCIDQTILQYFILEDIDKEWDEFDYSMANASLNDLMSHLLLRPHYQFKKLSEIDSTISRNNNIILRFNTRFNQNNAYVSLVIDPELLEVFLHRYHDPKSKNLDVMMDVPITVRVELGSLQRKVKEIMEFTQGTLLELDQTIDSPCKVIVNNHAIAYGDVVEVNGNFGVKMTKIDDTVDFMK